MCGVAGKHNDEPRGTGDSPRCPISMRGEAHLHALFLCGLSLLVACRPWVAKVAPQSLPAGAAPAANVAIMTEAVPLCRDQSLELRTESPVWRGCATLQNCTATLALEVRNCASSSAVPEQVRIMEDQPGVQYKRVRIWDLQLVVLGPGQSHTYHIGPLQDTWRSIALSVVWRDHGGEKRSSLQMAPLRSPARPEAESACQRCNGDFGPHGLRGTLGCVCRTADSGRPCDDGDACEGMCLFERFEKVPLPPLPPALPGRVLPLRRQLYRPVGRCSEFVGGWDCSQYIEKGASRRSPSNSLEGVQDCARE